MIRFRTKATNYYDVPKNTLWRWGVVYLVILIGGVALLLFATPPTGTCADWSEKSLPLHIAKEVFCSTTVGHNLLHLQPFHLWEIVAILQAILISGLVWWEAGDQRGFKLEAIMLILVGILAIVAGRGFFAGVRPTYHWGLWGMTVCFLLVDWMAFRSAIRTQRHKRDEHRVSMFKVAIWVVDFPVVVGVLSLNGYSYLSDGVFIDAFYAGAVAFQLVIGNWLLFYLRVRSPRALLDSQRCY